MTEVRVQGFSSKRTSTAEMSGYMLRKFLPSATT